MGTRWPRRAPPQKRQPLDRHNLITMESLSTIVGALDDFFDVAESGADPAFSCFLPAAYEAAPLSWQSWTEPAFAIHFNGLMVRGGATVHTVFLAAFPSAGVLEVFLARAEPGDLLFVHHPIDLESGDPKGTWGRFATALGATVTGEFFPYGRGHVGVIATIPAVSCGALEEHLRRLFGVTYLDTAGAKPTTIETVAIVAGAGDRVEQMQHAEASGAAAYITGEIHSRIDTEYGHRKFADVERFAAANPGNRSICPSRSPRTHISAFAES